MYMLREEKYISNDFQLEQFDSTRTVMNLSLRPIKFMSLMSCSAVKMYFFRMFMIFYQRKFQLSRNRMRLELTSSSFQVKRNIILKRKNMGGRRKCWLKKRRTSAWWDMFLNNEVMNCDWLENF